MDCSPSQQHAAPASSTSTTTDITKRPSVFIRLRNTPIEFKRPSNQYQTHILHSRLAPSHVKSKVDSGYHSTNNNNSNANSNQQKKELSADPSSSSSSLDGCVSILNDCRNVIVHAPSKCNYAHLPKQQHWFEFDGCFSALTPTEAQTMMPLLKEQHIHNAKNPLLQKEYHQHQFDRSLTSPPSSAAASSSLSNKINKKVAGKDSSSSSSLIFPNLPILENTPAPIEDQTLFEKVVEPALNAVIELRCPGLLACHGMTGTGKSRCVFGSEAQMMSSIHNNLITANKGCAVDNHSSSAADHNSHHHPHRHQTPSKTTNRNDSNNIIISPSSVYSASLAIANDPANHQANPGLVQLACNRLLEQYPLGICVSFFEVYNERLRCLFSGKEVTTVLTNEGMLFRGLARAVVKSNEELRKKINEGMKVRKAASTDRNDHSSRSHAILQMYPILEMREAKTKEDEDYLAALQQQQQQHKDGNIKTTAASSSSLLLLPMISERVRFTVVDLAGSERLVATSKVQQRESAQINLALSNLSRVIQSLSHLRSSQQQQHPEDEKSASAAVELQNQKHSVDPECRASMLTWALRDELQFKTAVTFLITISPMTAHANETLSSLRFAGMLRSIRTVIKVQPNGALSSHELKVASELMAKNFDLNRHQHPSQQHVPMMEMSPSRYGNNNKNSNNNNNNKYSSPVLSPNARKPLHDKNLIKKDSYSRSNTNNNNASSPKRSKSVVSVLNPFEEDLKNKNKNTENIISIETTSTSTQCVPPVSDDDAKENRSTSVEQKEFENATTQYSPKNSTEEENEENHQDEIVTMMIKEDERNPCVEEELDEIIEFAAIVNEEEQNINDLNEEFHEDEDFDSVPVYPIRDASETVHDTDHFEGSPSRRHQQQLFRNDGDGSIMGCDNSGGSPSSTLPDLDKIEAEAAAAKNETKSYNTPSRSASRLRASIRDSTFAFVTSANINTSALDSIIIDQEDEKLSERNVIGADDNNSAPPLHHHHQLHLFSATTPILNLGNCDFFVAGKLDCIRAWWKQFKTSSPVYRSDLIVSCIVLANNNNNNNEAVDDEDETKSCFVLSRSSRALVERHQEHHRQSPTNGSCSPYGSPSPRNGNTHKTWAWWGQFWQEKTPSSDYSYSSSSSSSGLFAKITRARQTESIFISDEDQLAFALQHGDGFELLSNNINNTNDALIFSSSSSISSSSSLQLRFHLVDASRGPVATTTQQRQNHQKSSGANNEKSLAPISADLMKESKFHRQTKIIQPEITFLLQEKKEDGNNKLSSNNNNNRRSVSFCDDDSGDDDQNDREQEEQRLLIETNCNTARSLANFVAPHSERKLFHATTARNENDENSSDEHFTLEDHHQTRVHNNTATTSRTTYIKRRQAASISTSSVGSTSRSHKKNATKSASAASKMRESTSSSAKSTSAPGTEPSPHVERHHNDDVHDVEDVCMKSDNNNNNHNNADNNSSIIINSTSTSNNPSAANSKQNSEERYQDEPEPADPVENRTCNNNNMVPSLNLPVRHQTNNSLPGTHHHTSYTAATATSSRFGSTSTTSTTTAISSNVSRATSASPIISFSRQREMELEANALDHHNKKRTDDENNNNNNNNDNDEDYYDIDDEDQCDRDDDANIFTVERNNNNSNNKKKKKATSAMTMTKKNSFTKTSTRKSVSKSMVRSNNSSNYPSRAGSSISVAVSDDGIGQIDENFLFDGFQNNNKNTVIPATIRRQGSSQRVSSQQQRAASKSPSSSSMITPRYSARKKRFATPLEAIRGLAPQPQNRTTPPPSSPASFFRKFKARIDSLLHSNNVQAQPPKKVSSLTAATAASTNNTKSTSSATSNNNNGSKTFSRSPNRQNRQLHASSLDREEQEQQFLEQGKASLKNLVESRSSVNRKRRDSSTTTGNNNNNNNLMPPLGSSTLTKTNSFSDNRQLMKRHLSHLSP